MRRVKRVGIWAVVLVIFTAATTLRLSHLDQPVYWGDEVYSSLRIFGHTTTHLRETIAAGTPVTASEIQSFQAILPNHGIYSTLKSIAIEDSHIAPLYFFLARIWASIFGDSAASLRSLAAVFGILSIPAMYYLAVELFQPDKQSNQSWKQVKATAHWAMVLVAVSPLQFLMAREARSYSLWTLLTILSSIFLLRALKHPTWERWGLFAIMQSLTLYSHFLGVISCVSYLIYVLTVYWRRQAIVRQFGLATSLSFISFLPWASIFLTRQIVDNRDSEGLVGPYHWRLAIRNWFTLIHRLFIDFDTTPSTSIGWGVSLTGISLIAIGLTGYGLYRIYQRESQHIWLFLTLMILPLPLCFFDRSLQGLLPPRYLLPSYLGIQLVLAYTLGEKSTTALQRNRPWPLLMAGIVAMGLLSCGQAVAAETWWNKRFSNCNPQIARIVNRSTKPLVISDGTGGQFFDHGLSNLVSLSRDLKPDVAMQVGLETTPPLKIGQDYSDRFVITPSQILRARLETAYPGKLEPVLKNKNAYRGSKVCLWRLLP